MPPQSATPARSPLALLGRAGVFLVPAALVGVALVLPTPPDFMTAAGSVAAMAGLAAALLFLPTGEPRSAKALPVALFVLGYLFWMIAVPARIGHPLGLIAPALLLAGAATLVCDWALSLSPARAIRRARRIAARIAGKKAWPNDLAACTAVPEVAEFREALRIDATPALELLTHPRLEVRAAALGALRGRPVYRPGQSGLVLQVAQTARDPVVRTAAIQALARSESRHVVETLGKFLSDGDAAVRRVATETLLWQTEQRWMWVRFHVQAALANPAFAIDGPLFGIGNTLSPQALTDLLAWAGDTGTLAVRAVETLKRYFLNALEARPSPDLHEHLRRLLFDPKCPSLLRVEVGHMLHARELLNAEQVAALMATDNPAPLRMMGADAVLANGPNPDAEQALRELARMPNREIAVAVAQIVQARLGIPMGLHPSAPPSPHTRQAGEVTRRVQDWATGRTSWYDTAEPGRQTPPKTRAREE